MDFEEIIKLWALYSKDHEKEYKNVKECNKDMSIYSPKSLIDFLDWCIEIKNNKKKVERNEIK